MNTYGFFSLLFGMIGYFCFQIIYMAGDMIMNDSGNDVRPFWFIVGGACLIAAGILIGGKQKNEN
jgi:hypothetical protein